MPGEQPPERSNAEGNDQPEPENEKPASDVPRDRLEDAGAHVVADCFEELAERLGWPREQPGGGGGRV